MDIQQPHTKQTLREQIFAAWLGSMWGDYVGGLTADLSSGTARHLYAPFLVDQETAQRVWAAAMAIRVHPLAIARLLHDQGTLPNRQDEQWRSLTLGCHGMAWLGNALPLLLFFHDDRPTLHQHLTVLAEVSNVSASDRADLTPLLHTLGDYLSVILRHQPLSGIDAPSPLTDLTTEGAIALQAVHLAFATLQQPPALILERSLQRVRQTVSSSSPLSLAIYRCRLAGIAVGALLGAYYGRLTGPVMGGRSPLWRQWHHTLWGVSSLSGLQQETDILSAVWAGHQWTSRPPGWTDSTAIAAAQVLQPR